MERILLIQPPEYLKKTIPTEDFLGLSFPALGLTYIAAALQKAGYKVKIIDPVPLGWGEEEILKEIKNWQPEIIGFTAVTPTFPKVLKLAQKIKKERPEITTIIGGPHLTAAPRQTISFSCFDFGVIGEGEKTIVELVSHLAQNKKGLVEIPGLVFRKGKKIVFTPPRPFIENLYLLPFPARELLPPLSLYHPNPGTYKNFPVGSLISSRGCPFKCIFCDRAVFGNLYRFRTPKNVVDEIEILLNDFGAKEIRIWDDTFNFLPERVIKICQEILKRKLKFSWTCLGRVNFPDEKMLKMMKKAGCWQISYGIESGNPEILKRIQKGLTKEMVRQAVKKTHQAGIEVKGFFMLGLPGETKKTMQETIDFAKELNLDIATFSITTPFPGTELYQEVKKTGEFKKMSFSRYLPYYPTSLSYVPDGLSQKDLLEFEKKAHFEFYVNARYVLRELFKIRTVPDLGSKSRAFLRLLKHWI